MPRSKRSAYSRRNALIRSLGLANTYQEYLKTDIWKEIRCQVMERDKRKCRLCEARASDVHHTDYGAATLVGRRLAGLFAVCRQCHEAIEFADGRKLSIEEMRAAMNGHRPECFRQNKMMEKERRQENAARRAKRQQEESDRQARRKADSIDAAAVKQRKRAEGPAPPVKGEKSQKRKRLCKCSFCGEIELVSKRDVLRGVKCVQCGSGLRDAKGLVSALPTHSTSQNETTGVSE